MLWAQAILGEGEKFYRTVTTGFSRKRNPEIVLFVLKQKQYTRSKFPAVQWRRFVPVSVGAELSYKRDKYTLHMCEWSIMVAHILSFSLQMSMGWSWRRGANKWWTLVSDWSTAEGWCLE